MPGSHTTYDPEATTNNISHHGTGTQNQNGVDWKQFKYALRVQTIIDAIETKYTSSKWIWFRYCNFR